VSTAAALTTKGLGKRYRASWALRDVNLAVPAGSVAALVGPNGAGKTTLLQLVMGLLAPTEGTVRVLGERAGANTAQALARVGFVAQDHPLYAGLRVDELLRFGRHTNRRFGLGQRAGRLSSGQKAQVALVLALAKRPRLLLLDEPVASLDPLARREFMAALMGEVASSEVTAVVSSHVVAELERVADYLILLTGGRLRLAGATDDILAGHRLLTGPRTETPTPAAGEVITARQFERHSQLLVRGGPGPVLHPAWQAVPAGLEDIVLAYLQAPPAQPGRAAAMEVA
jgi:ABC-2 type transport system ATP-binding protein